MHKSFWGKKFGGLVKVSLKIIVPEETKLRYKFKKMFVVTLFL